VVSGSLWCLAWLLAREEGSEVVDAVLARAVVGLQVCLVHARLRRGRCHRQTQRLTARKPHQVHVTVFRLLTDSGVRNAM
jgi:uncharacterized membrane protein